MIYKKAFPTFLEPKYIKKIQFLMKKNGWGRREFLKVAFADFNKYLKKNKSFSPAYTEFDRIKLVSYVFHVFEEQNRIIELSEKFNISRVQVIREIVLYYFERNKDEF